MKIIYLIVLLSSLLSLSIGAADSVKNENMETTLSDKEQEAYRIERPGVLTFVHGTEFVVHVDKPQVEIILEKEKSKLMQFEDQPMFTRNIEKPLDLNTFIINLEPIE
ncbi:MAG: hypothetical protein AB1633_08185 [Elusimicrobiota bacterium]